MKKYFIMAVMLLSCMLTAWAEDLTYSPVLDVNFRTATGNTSWQAVKNAADEGNNDFELTYTAGFFALQKYTVPDLQNATKLVLTLTVGSKNGVDAVKLWAFTKNDWTAETGIDDIVPLVTAQTGIELRATEGTANTPLVNGAKVAGSDPAKATFTISGTALNTIKANATADGTFTLLLTNDNLTNTNNKRSYLSNNSANAEANRPTLVATIEKIAATVVNKTTGVGYATLTDAFEAAASAGTDAELEVSDDQTLTKRLTWNIAKTLTITPTKDITIKGHRNGMWFLNNAKKSGDEVGTLNIGSADYTITLDGQDNTFEYDVTKYEENGIIALTNVVFQNFDLNQKGHLIGSKASEGQIILDKVTFKNCKNPENAFINKLRVTNDRVVLKGFLNQEDCTGTTIYAASETKASGTTGRIKIDDADFTANNPITIEWPGTKDEGIVVVIGTTTANADKFQLTDDEWLLERKASNGDLYMAKPVEPTAKIGDETYADLSTALAAAQDGDVITLLADQELSARVNVKNMGITIDGQGQYAIKRAASYTNGLVFLTQKADDEQPASALTLKNVTLDGQSAETTAAFIEASNGGTTTLEGVTVKNVNTTADAAVINKGGGKLILDGVTFTGNTVGKADVFEGTSLTLKGQNTIPAIYVEKQLTLTATDATATTPIELKTDANRTAGSLIVIGGTAADFTSADFRLSQQVDGLYLMPQSVTKEYAHPGLLHTATDIARVKACLDQEPFASAYTRLEAQSGGSAAGAVEVLKRMDQANWSETYPDYGNFSRAATDAKLAYELALRYQLKGSTAAANAAVGILNNWVATCKGVLRLNGRGYTNNIADPNEYLITIQAYQFANAAELLRDYSGWQAADFATFQNWMRETFADVAYQFLENHHGNTDEHYWLNWDLAALTAMYSVGVLCDDQTLVDYAINYTTAGAGNGNISKATVATHSDPDSDETLAQCQESGRDQGHSTLNVTLLGAFCQMAQSQGTDLWTPYKALEMAEYIGKYNLKDASGNFVYDESKVPFTAYNNGEVDHTAISAEARGTVRPSWELFHAYARNNSKSDIYTKQWVDYMRQQNAYGEAEGTSTDELGFGTLMYGEAAATTYTLTVTEAGAATLVLPFGAALPEGVEAYTLTYAAGDETVTATKVDVITANQPVLIMAAADDYTFTSNGETNSNAPEAGNLTGVYVTTVVPAGSYILTKKDDTVAFRKADGTNYVAANHAYLTASASTARMLTVNFGNGNTTGIQTRVSETAADGAYYDLQGRRTEKPAKGLYIVNGKKVLVK